MQTRYGDGRLALTPVGQAIIGALALLYSGIHLSRSLMYPSLMLVLDVIGVLGGLMFVSTALLGFRDQARIRAREEREALVATRVPEVTTPEGGAS